jgi:putative oxidoreductase
MSSTTDAGNATSSRIDNALLILRLVLGAIMIAHGAQKLFVFGIAGITAGFTQMGVPLPAITAPLVSLLEFFGGIAIVIGLLTRLAALGLAIDMLGALLLVHGKNGFFLPAGYEFVLALFAMSAVLALAGAGRLSVDAMIARRRTSGA